jgi:predicted ArsR family transcriptional regulator
MAAPGGREEDLARRRHRALADPSRARILAELTGDAPLDTRELARRVGLHVNTVRAHLASLVDAGLVASDTAERAGRGRPRLVYRPLAGDASAEAGRRYRLLAEILTALVARFGPEAREQLEEIGGAWGHYLVESPPPFAEVSDDEAVGRLLELLAEVGFEPSLDTSSDPTGDRLRILMRPCPFLELAQRHRDVVCPIHLGLMRGALAELGAATTATELQPFVRPDLCVAKLSEPAAA